MRRLAALGVSALILTACGGAQREPLTPEEVVRAWGAAISRGDNEAAANLFAPDAQVIQGGFETVLADHEEALAFNTILPCSGQIVELVVDGHEVTATFLLGDRPASACDDPGGRATAVFTVVEGRIVRWQQTESEHAAGDAL